MPFFDTHYDPSVVALSIVIAVFASHVALDLAKRMRDGDRAMIRNWWIGGSVALGTGIWSMHFVGMLAFSIPVAIGYAPLPTVLSWCAATVVSAIALAVASKDVLGWRRLATGSATMGAGIFAMHYIGMAAIDMAPGIVWNPTLVAASLVIAVAASAVALQIFFWLRVASGRRGDAYQLLAATVMGLAISGMHYTAMAAASFPVGSICLSAGALGGNVLNILVAASAFMLLTIALLTSTFDARMQTRTALLAASLHAANDKLHREHERFRALTALSSDWFWEMDERGAFTDISASVASGKGIPSPHYFGKTTGELGWVPVDAEASRLHEEGIARRQTYRGMELQRVESDRRWRFVSNSGTPAFDEAGRFVGYLGVGRDITQQKQQERRQHLQLAVTQLLVSSTSIGEAASAVIRAVCEACGWPGGFFRRVDPANGETSIAGSWSDEGYDGCIDALSRSPDHNEQDRIASEGGMGLAFSCPVGEGRLYGALEFRLDDRIEEDESTLEVIRTLALQVGLLIARSDAKASVRAERGLLAERVAERTRELSETNRKLELAKAGAEEASRDKSAFLATISHEIRTPMNGVIGMIEVLEQTGLGEDQIDAVRTIRTSAFSLLTLIDDILDFSKAESGHLVLERAPVALGELAEGVCDLLDRDAAVKDVDLRLFVSPDLPSHVLSDATRLRQTFNNLVGNAIKFSAGRPAMAGRVTVRVEPAPGKPNRVALAVADNGIGIAPGTLEHLFQPFTQAEASTTRRFGGTGLGLVICQRLVTLMEGEITVQSELGVGSVFTVTLPLQPAEPVVAAPAGPDLDGVDCIVVDSPKFAAADLHVYLERAGARVQSAPGVRAAARAAAAIDDRPVVVVQQAGADLPAQRAARAAFGTAPNVRHVMLVGRSVSASASTNSLPGVVTMPCAGIRRAPFVCAVATAAGRAAPDGGHSQRPERTARPRRVVPTIAEARSNGRLILVAEDDPVNQKVVLQQLALLGYAAEVASNGAEALCLWQAGRHGLVLTDLHMPDLDGFGLASAIRAAEAEAPGQRRVPILALTANAAREESSRVRDAGMDEHLTKPIQLAALGKALDRWLPHGEPGAADAPTAPAELFAPAPGVAVDISVLKSLVGDEPDTVREFLSEYLKSARGQAAEIVESCAAEDNRRIGAVAHKLKASSRSVGALALGDLCAELENASRAGSRTEIVERREQFELAMKAVDACIVEKLTFNGA